MPREVTMDAQDIVTYVRYETVSAAEDFTPSVKAEVHDALWMLTQQWRIGEFRGEDAGTLIKAKLETQSSFLNRFKSRNGVVEPFDHTTPLEAKVERLPIIYDLGMQLEIGFQWYKALLKNNLGSTYSSYMAFFPVEDYTPPAVTDPQIESNKDSIQVRKLATGRMMDGGAFAIYLQTHNAWDVPNTTNSPDLVNAQQQFKDWLSRTYYQPTGIDENSWSDTQLEYQFSMSTPLSSAAGANQALFLGDQYMNGTVDWYSVDVNADPTGKLTETPANSISNANLPASYGGKPVIGPSEVISYIPQTIDFKGMPKSRWWEFEDRNIDIAKMLTQKQDISKVILMEFGLIYSNDWFVIPHELENGTLTEIKGMSATDVFGRQFLIERVDKSETALQQEKWDMFNNSRNISIDTADNSYGKLLLMPSLINKMESEAFEKVMFLRDEVANMVWAVEDIVPNDFFSGMSGKNAADDLIEFLLNENPITSLPVGYVPNDALLRYKLSSSVPENWIPFIATRTNDTSRIIKLQRAALLRDLHENIPQVPITPRTNILSIDLGTAPYFINEEEVSNSGFVLTTTFQRTRWYDGSTYVWLGRKRQTGRGEANSGYVFDILVDKEPDAP